MRNSATNDVAVIYENHSVDPVNLWFRLSIRYLHMTATWFLPESVYDKAETHRYRQ